ncbi:hypothetical protein MMC25_006402 [Agyrium rufum]|nr:hypothetical protein [Agyrium rufum]
MESILATLNDAQVAAVTSPSTVVQILAPPGSGKTKTLTSRVAYLLAHENYQPWDVICLTFTNKSAKEMGERVAKMIGDDIGSKLILGTFHSVCRRYLVRYGHLIGLRKGFSIADSSDTVAIITRIVKQSKLNIDPKTARSRISSSKARNQTYELLVHEAGKKPTVDQQEFVKVFRAYEEHLKLSNLLDFDDLLLRCLDLLTHNPECVRNVQVVLVDEFQDTNIVQLDLLRLFASKHNRITTVGDPDQSIYGWRSAEIKNLRRMKEYYPESHIMHLEDNYRSSGSILLAALEVIQQDESRPQKSLLPTHCPGTNPVLRHLPTAAAEASWIVTEIKRLVAFTGNMLAFPDFAILLRSAALSRNIESEMGKAGLPYRMVGGRRFFDRKEVKVLLDYLRVISQPDNSDALSRIINVPSRRIGEITINALLEEAGSKGKSLWALLGAILTGGCNHTTKIAKPAEKSLNNVCKIISTARWKIMDNNQAVVPSQLLEYVVDRIDFREYLKTTYTEDHESRWANVEELVAQATESNSEISGDSQEAFGQDDLPLLEGLAQDGDETYSQLLLSTFLANVALSTELEKDDEKDVKAKAKGRITISTIHAAKGLEWPVVFIPSVYEGSIPHSRAEDTNEERRLLYVAMTRAQALLYMSCPKKNSFRDDTKLSSFLIGEQIVPFLVDKGPPVASDTVMDIARILHRSAPKQAAITECLKDVKSTEDDLWPTDGSMNPENQESRWNQQPNECTLPSISHWFQLSRTIAAAQNAGPSKQTYTIPPATAGFITASVHMHQQPPSIDSTATKRAKSAESSDRKQLARKGSSGKGQVKGNTLIKMWSHQSESLTNLTPTAMVGALTSTDSCIDMPIVPKTSNSALTICLSETAVPTDRDGNIPHTLRRHVLKPSPGNRRPPHIGLDKNAFPFQGSYVFLSSSPPPIPADGKFEIQDRLKTNANELPRAIRPPLSTPKINVKPGHKLPPTQSIIDSAQPTASTTVPSKTFYTTTMDLAQSDMKGSSSSKSLGVRRSVIGWKAPTLQTPFRPPKRKAPP